MADFKQHSYARRALIAHGNDGIEFALPMDKLGLQAPNTVQILLAEQAHFLKKQGYSEGLINLE